MSYESVKSQFNNVLKEKTKPLPDGEEKRLIEEYNQLKNDNSEAAGNKRQSIIDKILMSWYKQIGKVALDVYMKMPEEQRKSIDIEDFVQEAFLLAYKRVVNNFDFEYGVKPITYLRDIIQKSLYTKYCQSMPTLIRYPHEYEVDANRIFKAISELESERTVIDAEKITDHINKNTKESSEKISLSRVIKIQEMGYHQPISVETPMGEDDDGNEKILSDYIKAVGEGSNPEEEIICELTRWSYMKYIEAKFSKDDYQMVLMLMNKHSSEEIKAYFGLKSDDELFKWAESIGEKFYWLKDMIDKQNQA